MKITPKDPTTGLSSQAAVEAVENRYDLVLIAARRVEEHRFGAVKTALLEIEAGKVGRDYLYKENDVAPRRRHKG